MEKIAKGKNATASVAPDGSADRENQAHWSDACVAKARQGNPLVTDAVSEIVAEVLRGALSERALTAAELTALAKRLIDDMARPKPATNQDPEAPA